MLGKKVSIIIPCRNEVKFIGSCLETVISQDYPKDLFEVLVIDGMSDDRTREILAQYKQKYTNIKILDNPRRIVPVALNIGIKYSQSDVIIIMGAHAEYAPDYISMCTQVLEQTGADNVGGAARTKAKGYIQNAVSIAFKTSFGVGGAKSHYEENEGYVDTVTYGCYHRKVFDKIGLFDEELVRNQDDELNLRLTLLGGKIWQSPEIKSWYHPRASLCALFKQYMQYGYWKVRVIQKHKIPAAIRHIIPGTFVGSLILLAVMSVFSTFFLKIFIGLLAIYFLTTVGASIIACIVPSKWKYIPIMPVIFIAYHFGYGYGFLRGVLDFIILKKRANEKFTKLTRSTKDNLKE